MDLRIDQNSVQIGNKIQLQINTSPKSLCTLSAIDKSVTLIGKRNSVNLEKVVYIDWLFGFNLNSINIVFRYLVI